MEENKNNTIDTDRIFINKLSRWMDKRGRLFIIHSIFHAWEKVHNKEASIVRSSLNLLDVHGEKETVVPYKKFLQLIINGEIMPWKDKK